MIPMNQNVIIRKADVSDIEAIIRMEQLCFNEESFSRRQIRYLITKAKADFLVAEEEELISAFIVLLKRVTGTGMRIYSVAVSPSHRGKGLAGQLLNEAEKRARANRNQYLVLEVSEINEVAIKLYLRSGFEIFGERPSYYKNGSKALLMRKMIS